MYKLRDWVDETQLKKSLSYNERAVEYLENHNHLIDNRVIFTNEEAIHIIEKKIRKNTYNTINYNKNAVNFLWNNRKYIKYHELCGEEHGIEFVDELIKKDELDKIGWEELSKNPAAMHILNDPKYYEYIDWKEILYNKNAAELVKNNLHMVGQYWVDICMQPHLIEIIEQNLNNNVWHKTNIVWWALSYNCNAIHILEKNINKIDLNALRYNKNGFNLLLQLNHVFNDHNDYHKNIVLEYFDYCEKNNRPFNLISQLSRHGYTEKHMEFLKHNNNYNYLSVNPNIFEYDYNRMRETRQLLPWYNDIKKN